MNNSGYRYLIDTVKHTEEQEMMEEYKHLIEAPLREYSCYFLFMRTCL